MLLDKTVADKARTPGSDANGVARALTLTALTQLKGEGPERRSLVFQILRESNFPILAGTKEKSDANLVLYDLRRTNLSGAILRRANLIDANLSEAELMGAYLGWADLFETNLSGANLEEIQWNEQTKWPDRSNFVGAENILEDLKNLLGL